MECFWDDSHVFFYINPIILILLKLEHILILCVQTSHESK